MADDDWFWLHQGQSRGPVPATELDALYHRGELTAATPVWRMGQDQWKPFSEVFPDAVKQPPPLPAAPAAALRAGPFWTDRSAHPWRRFFARLLDTVVNGSICFFAIGIIVALIDLQAIDAFSNATGSNRAFDAMMTALAAIPINALLIGLTGGTLGKWLFGVRVLGEDGRPIGFGGALLREGSVWVKGMAIGIPLINLVTWWLSYQKLIKDSVTSWDQPSRYVVLHRPKGTRQVIGVIVGVLTWITVIIGLSFLAEI